MIISGFSEDKNQKENSYVVTDTSTSFILMITITAALLVPFIEAWANITNRRMKGIHENTVSCYVNSSMIVIMFLVILVQGETDTLIKLF